MPSINLLGRESMLEWASGDDRHPACACQVLAHRAGMHTKQENGLIQTKEKK
jgi:hypothetical protein